MTERNLSELERTTRVDAEFFQKRYVGIDAALNRLETDPIAEPTVFISDGNHFSISDSFVDSGIPYYRGQDAVGHFFIEQSSPMFIPPTIFEEPHLRRSHLRAGDVLLSIVGSIGEASLVTSPGAATCSCKLAILRSKLIEPSYLATFLRSKTGRSLTERWTRGAVQRGLLLEDMHELRVPRWSQGLEGVIRDVVTSARISQQVADEHIEKSRYLLEDHLGIRNWAPKSPLSYERTSLDVLDYGRMDAEFFSPRILAMLDRLGASGRRLGDAAIQRKTKFAAKGRGAISYIELGSISADGIPSTEDMLARDAPSRATWMVREGDVLAPLVRPGRGMSALVPAEQDGAVCSSGFAVLHPKTVPGELLLAFLRLPIVLELQNLFTTASMYPAIAIDDLLNLPMPPISQEVEREIVLHHTLSCQIRARSSDLLRRATEAVDIAIENGEEAALRFIRANG